MPARIPQWVFGMYDTQMKQGYMTLVPSRNALTLLPIIEEHTLPGSIILSNMWAAYRQVARLPTVVAHETVNHRRHFVDPTTGAHTQAIESYWARAKAKLKRMMGTTKEMLPSYLDEFMWKERHGRNTNGQINDAVVLSKMISYKLRLSEDKRLDGLARRTEKAFQSFATSTNDTVPDDI